MSVQIAGHDDVQHGTIYQNDICPSADHGSLLENLHSLSSTILDGTDLEEALELIFSSFHQWIPYERVGYADIDIDTQVARSRWAKSSEPILLRKGYSASLAGSSLSVVLSRRQPRVLNNLPQYLKHRPQSRSTMMIVKEGFKSSMTCPLFIKHKPLGLLFFTSRELNAYTESHVSIMKEIAVHLASLLMASQHTVSLATQSSGRRGGHDHRSAQPHKHSPGTAAIAKNSKANSPLLLSQLKPGMILEASIRCGDNLLLAAGRQLTVQSIARLNVLRAKGLLETPFVLVK